MLLIALICTWWLHVFLQIFVVLIFSLISIKFAFITLLEILKEVVNTTIVLIHTRYEDNYNVL